ncbi:hypothetical protein ABZ671_18910 [Micromonospora sp. NPDC006766]|uniref:hypothetical protein n=1 Tax=Micromonospora sp. NPDC006766 TaxID=3154778 RepID=UPI0033C55D14
MTQPPYLYGDPDSRFRWHYIDLRHSGWMLDHPAGCNSLDCPVRDAAKTAITFPPPVTGEFPCTVDEQGRLLVVNTRPTRSVTSPGSARLCSWLACPARYDAVAVATGEATAAGWRQWPSLNLQMCPDHAWVWTPRDAGEAGPHEPRLNNTTGTPVLRCACGTVIDSAGLNGRKLAETYLLHLLREEQANAARTAFERAGTYLDDTDTLDAMLAEIADKATGSHAIAKRSFYANGELEFPAAYAVLCHLLAVTAAARAALGMEATPTATDLMGGEHRKIGPMVHALDGAAHSVYLHGEWRWLSSKMTTEEREAFAGAVERYSAGLDPDGPPISVDCWWRVPAQGEA